MNIEVKINEVYVPFLDHQAQRQIFFGGSSSGKSVFLSQRCILDVLDPKKGRNYLIVRNVAKTIRQSTFNELQKVISEMGLDDAFNVNKSDMVITCKLSGYQIISCGLDDPQKIKSITPAKGVITDIWIEEASEVDFHAYKELTKRLRGESIGNKRITLSFNPILKTHWAYTEFFNNWDESKNQYVSDELVILKTTYKDNKFLTQDDIYTLENETDEYYRNVYTYGNWGVLGAVIFRNWKSEDCSKIKEIADNYRNGLDFGFAVDPSAIIRTHYDKKNKTIYILEEFYQPGLTNNLLAVEIRKMVGSENIVCDSAEPKSIHELKSLGISALSAKKGRDSVIFGIQWLQQHNIIIDIHCQHTKNEFSQYKWKEDASGNAIPIPLDKNNHLIDALRYAYEMDMNRGRGWGW